MKVAALDLGTNTFLCLIADVSKNGIETVYQDLVQTVRLGQGLIQSNAFHPDALERARNTLVDFKKQIDAEKVERVLAMATSAARDASNGEELLKIGEALGIPIEIIPGQVEAQLTYRGAIVGHKTENKKTLVIDVGGGSTELILGQRDKILFKRSLDIGAVRLTEKLISEQPVSFTESKVLLDFIQTSTADSLSNIINLGVDQVIASAGTPTSLAAIELGGFDEKKVDGFKFSLEKMKSWQNIFGSTSIEEKRNRYGLGGRADIIYVGVSILISVLEGLPLKEMTVSTKGVRYGVAMEILSR